MLLKVDELSRAHGDLKYDYQEFKGHTNAKLSQTVSLTEYREGMGALEKKIYADIAHL
jgi:hypothetical protein